MMSLNPVTAQTVYFNGVAQSGVPIHKMVVVQATTDSNGLATIDLVDENGDPVFDVIWSTQAICVVEATLNQNWPFATVKSIAEDRKSLVVQTTKGTSVSVLLGGTIVSMSPAPNTPIHVTVMGV